MSGVRVGIIGCGVMGIRHAKATNTHEHAKTVAVADLDKGRAEKMAAEVGATEIFDDGMKLIDNGSVDAVIIALPTQWRTPLALHALKKGLHVLLEKPVAENANRVKELQAAAGDRIVGTCSSRFAFLPSTQAAAACVARGDVGNIRTVTMRCMLGASPKPEATPPEWRLKKSLNGGGILLNWGCYDLDYLMTVTGWTLKPQSVFAQTWGVPGVMQANVPEGSDAETHFCAHVRCENNIALTVERAEYVTAQPVNAWGIIGDKGGLTLWMLPKEGKQITLTRYDLGKGLVDDVIWKGKEDADLVHVSVVLDFIDAIREKRPCSTDMSRAWVVQRLSDAIYESAESGTLVPFGA